MKPANLLIFRDQRVKVGDLGISIKLDDDDDWDTPKYAMKGITKGYATLDTLEAFKKSSKLSKRQLFEADKHALIVTMKKII